MEKKCNCKEKFETEFGFYSDMFKVLRCMQCSGILNNERVRKIKEYNTPRKDGGKL